MIDYGTDNKVGVMPAEVDHISGVAETVDTADAADFLTSADFSALSREELESKAEELQDRIIDLEKRLNPPPNDWHSWFYILLEIALHSFKKDNVRILREVVLGAMPPRADFIVVEEGEIVDLGLSVFKFFRKYNILEFKNPDDELSESVLWKVVGYAGFYIDHDKVSPDEITLTLVRAAKPKKLFKQLGKCVRSGTIGDPNGSPAKGIYTIENWKVSFPIQVVVTSELEGEEYAAFRTISKKPRMDDIRRILDRTDKESDPEVKELLREFLAMLSKLDRETIEEAKRRDPNMDKTWMDIFKTEIDERVDNALSNDRRTNLYIYVQNGDMKVENAARNANMTTADFEASMIDAGYKLPNNATIV